MIKRTHPEVFLEEWVLGADKKQRYCGPIRTEVYRTLLGLLDGYFPGRERMVLSTEPARI